MGLTQHWGGGGGRGSFRELNREVSGNERTRKERENGKRSFFLLKEKFLLSLCKNLRIRRKGCGGTITQGAVLPAASGAISGCLSFVPYLAHVKVQPKGTHQAPEAVHWRMKCHRVLEERGWLVRSTSPAEPLSRSSMWSREL